MSPFHIAHPANPQKCAVLEYHNPYRFKYWCSTALLVLEYTEQHRELWDPPDAAWESDRLRQKQDSLLKKPAVVELARFRRRLPAYKEKSKILQLIALNKVQILLENHNRLLWLCTVVCSTVFLFVEIWLCMTGYDCQE